LQVFCWRTFLESDDPKVHSRAETALKLPSSRLKSSFMRWGKLIALFAFAVAAMAADQPSAIPVLPCGEGAANLHGCNPSKKELKEAKDAFSKGIKAERANRLEDAYEQFKTAADLSPRNTNYVTARELIRQQLVFEHLKDGNVDLLKGNQVSALANFRNALSLDPKNEFAQQRLQDAIGRAAPAPSQTPTIVAESGILQVQPNPVKAAFHFTGDSKTLLMQVAAAFGVVASIDDSVQSRRVKFDIEPVDFFTAMGAAGEVTHSFWSAAGENQVIVAGDTAENHRLYDRLAMRTFYIPGATSPTDLNDVVNLLRTVFEIRFVTPQPQSQTVVVRAPQNTLAAATKIVEGLGNARPQVMLDVQVFQISHTLMRNMGIHIPNQFTLFNIPVAALGALGGQNISDLINQLIAGGGINQAGSQAVSALLAQLSGQANSVFSQPLATFGGGLTLSGLSLGTASATLSVNESDIKNLEHATLRVAQGNEANFRIGTRYPILNASFAPIFNTPQISQVIQNNSFTAAFPSFNYEDLGLTLKAKPAVSSSLDVTLNLEMQIRSLGTASLNGVPVISNREYKGAITLKNGEPGVVAGEISRTETRSLNGIPGLGEVPGLNRITATNATETDDSELLVLITPHVLAEPAGTTSEVWLDRK
jgi:type II secretory pathway component GspD/PulD (secretin)